MAVTVRITVWRAEAVIKGTREEMSRRLNKAGAVGVTAAQAIAPRDTGFMANTMEVVHRATPAELFVTYGNITADYTLWQEIGSQGRPGRYFLRRSLDQAVKALQ